MGRTRVWIGATLLAAATIVNAPVADAGSGCFGRERTRTVGPNATGHYYGTNGNDVIVGRLTGNSGSLVVHGKDGDDRICVSTNGGILPLRLKGEEGNDKLRGARMNGYGGPGRDTIIDWLGSGLAYGGDGADRMLDEGGSGDYFYGEGGNDYINLNPHGGYAFGGAGEDTCVGRVPPSKFQSCEE
jgi:Ca2+-binding RTX toxin-like protein